MNVFCAHQCCIKLLQTSYLVYLLLIVVIADSAVLIELQSLLERGYELVSGGTENHLVLVNLRNKVNVVIRSSENFFVYFYLKRNFG